MIEHDDIIDALGGVAQDIGEPGFHLRLFELIGTLLPHEMGWIVRYGGDSEPDVLHTKDVSPSMVDYYLEATPRSSDPYLCSWRSNAAPRVETMDAALPLAIDRDFYSSDFMKKFAFKDELVLFLPCSGTSCLSLFLERRDRRFSQAELMRVRRLFPALLKFHHAHIRSSFTSMSGAITGHRSFEDSAACIIDRSGTLVFSTQKWRDLGRGHSEMEIFSTAGSCDEVRERAATLRLPFRIVTLDALNSIAPGGLIVCLDDELGREAASAGQADTLMQRLTPRERDIIALTLDGLSTGAIAQRLGIAKGSIKNYRLRMYRKFGVTSERALTATMMPFAEQLKEKLAERH